MNTKHDMNKLSTKNEVYFMTSTKRPKELRNKTYKKGVIQKQGAKYRIKSKKAQFCNDLENQ